MIGTITDTVCIIVGSIVGSMPDIQGRVDRFAEQKAVGGLLIIASGLKILNLKDCKTLNLLPSLLVPIVFYLVKCTIL